MKRIKLTQGKYALVDDEDFEWLNSFKWFAVFDGYNWYVARKLKGKAIKLHTFLLNTPKGKEVDHVDGNGLNNQRNNLRICTHAENCMNRGKNKKNTSGTKGVSWHKASKKWIAQIKKGQKIIHLGIYSNKKDAINARKNGEKKYFSEFTRIK